VKNLKVDLDSFKINVEKKVKVRDLLIDIPIKYKCEAINALFTISSKTAAEIIGTKKLKPLVLLPGRSLMCITILNFYDTPVGRFTELTFSLIVGHATKFNIPFISFPIKYVTKKFGFIPISVAQSTDLAIEHGNIITGYPHYKQLTVANFAKTDKFIEVDAYSNNEWILKFKIKKPLKEKVKYEYHTTYSLKDMKVSKIKLETFGVFGDSKAVEFKLGDQELSKLLKNLKISKKPLYTRYYRDTLKIIGSPKYLEDL
jgi:hypothetical protein